MELRRIENKLMHDVQPEVLSILVSLINRYTAGLGSSVKENTAISILNSMYYVMNAYVISLGSSKSLLSVLKKEGADNVYKNGLTFLNSYFDETQKLYNEIAESKLNIPLITYNETINDALPQFFKTYNIEFNAQDTKCDIDYPLAFDNMNIEGVLYIRQYLEKLKMETEFCSQIDIKKINKFINSYENKFQIEIIHSPINLFGILFDQSFFSTLSGSENISLTISRADFSIISDKLLNKKHDEIICLIDDIVQKIIIKFKIKNKKLIDYIAMYKKQFAGRLIGSLEHNNILNMVVVDGDNLYSDKILFNDAERIEDMNFAHLIDIIEKCEDTNEKIKLVSSSIHSVRDYIDLLESDCLYGDEYTAFFNSLDDILLAVLGNTIFYQEFKYDDLNFSYSILKKYKKNAEHEWETYYIDFLTNMNVKRKSSIENIIKNLVCSNM